MTSPPASDRPGGASNGSAQAGHAPETVSESLTMAKASERLIQRFGGIRPMANKLEVPVTTVQGWKKRGAIPATRLADLRVAARRHNIQLEEADLDALVRADERPPESEPEPAPLPVPAADPVAETPPPAAAPAPAPAPAPASRPAPASVAPAAAAVAAPPPVPPRVPPVLPPEPPPYEAPPRPTRLVNRAAATADPPVSPAAVAAAAARLAAGPVVSSAGSRLMALGPARLSLAAAVVALLAAAVAVWSSPTSGPAVPADLESKVTRVALERSAELEKRLGALDARLSEAAPRKAADELAERVARLEKDLPALQQRVSAQGLGSPAVAVLLASTQLRTALAANAPFVNELAALRLTGFNDPPLKQSLDQIGSRAQTGIATEAWLIGRFSTVQGNILRAATIGDPAGRVTDIFLDMMSDWAPPLYRLTGVPEGATPRAIADRAITAMSAGDFARAVERLGELTGLPAEVAAPWLAEARARVIADRARGQLARLMLAMAQPGAK